MPKLLPALAAAALATALVAAPAVAANASTKKPTPAYTLEVTGNGSRAVVYWSAVRTDGSVVTGAQPQTPVTHLPWRHHVTAKATFYQVSAIQKGGTRLHCSIRDASGHVLSTSTSVGRRAVVSCAVTTQDLFSLAGMR